MPWLSTVPISVATSTPAAFTSGYVPGLKLAYTSKTGALGDLTSKSPAAGFEPVLAGMVVPYLRACEA